MSDRELSMGALTDDAAVAADLAADAGEITWLTERDGKRVAAIVPALLAERALRQELGSPTARLKFLNEWFKAGHDAPPRLGPTGEQA